MALERHKLGALGWFDREYRSRFFGHDYRSIAEYEQHFRKKKKGRLYSNKYGTETIEEIYVQRRPAQG